MILFLRVLPAVFSLFFPALPGGAQDMVSEEVYFREEERYLREFDINDPANEFSLLGDLDGSSMILKIKDPEGRTAGVFKPTSGNTYHVSEIVAYRLCRRMKLPVCAPAVPKTLDRESIARFAEILEEKTFQAPERSRHRGHYRAKERFRKAMLDRLDAGDTLPGAFKSWISPLVLYEGLGRIKSAKAHPLYRYLKHDGPPVSEKTLELRQCTRIYTPAGCYRAEITVRELAEQFTGILIVDALIGNLDRFSGGNVHLFSLEGRVEKEGPGRYRLPSPSLLMLDNGAGFMRRSGGGLRTLRKKMAVTRFPRKQHEAFLALWEDYARDPDRVLRELGIVERFSHAGRTFHPARAFDRNIERLADYIFLLQKRHGPDSVF